MVEILIMPIRGTVKEVVKMFSQKNHIPCSRIKEKKFPRIPIRLIVSLMRMNLNSLIPCPELWTLSIPGCPLSVESNNSKRRNITTSLLLKNVVLSELQMLIILPLLSKLWKKRWLILRELPFRDRDQPSSRAMTTSTKAPHPSPTMRAG